MWSLATVSTPPGGPVRDAEGRAHPPGPLNQNLHVSTKAWEALAWSISPAGLGGETGESKAGWSQVTWDPQRRGDLSASAGNTFWQQHEAGINVRDPLGREAKWRQMGEVCEPTQF